jgi:hypothetical protein
MEGAQVDPDTNPEYVAGNGLLHQPLSFSYEGLLAYPMFSRIMFLEQWHEYGGHAQ